MNDITLQRDPLKRGFDLLFSLFALLVSAPLFLLIAVLVVSTSRGPIIYRSLRLGQGGRTIACLKFRTMYRDADDRLKELLQTDPEKTREWNTYQKLKKDPRITPVGIFLRRTSLDEIPQFWNVLKGDLSIVGPRPPTLMGPATDYLNEIHTLYGDDTRTILSVRPGITGIWQVSGRSEISLPQRKKLETHYAQTRTFWTDLLLIVKTIPAVLFSKGAF